MSHCKFGGNRRKLCDSDLCQHCFDRSLAAHPMGKRLIGTDPRIVAIKSNKKYWFSCDCGHKFKSSAFNITDGYGCPYYTRGCRKLCDDEDCEMCFANSFASSEFAIYFDEAANGVSPRQVLPYSCKKYWFNCDCGHKFKTDISSVSRGSWCSYCSKMTRKLCDDSNCVMCFDNSLASHVFAQYLDEEKSGIKARQVIRYSNKKYWFKCEICSDEIYNSPAYILNRYKRCLCTTCKKSFTGF